ncbi:hypothetical protein RB195_013771 [Necator americanus]|uniref:Uncharacterized protein n=2 Tax=Necator americanus TaxID=51031 RepID=A0ABR1DX47_NECAM
MFRCAHIFAAGTSLNSITKHQIGVRFGRYRWNLDDPSLDRSFFDESNVFPPFIRYREYFQDIPEYRLCTCFIEKVMSTIRDGIFCYLRDPIEFVVQNRRISTENYVNRFCSPAAVDRKMCSYTTEKSSRRLKFAVVRDPIDRFLSGYADKCYPKQLPLPPERCFGCEQNINCFVETLLSKLRDLLRNSNAMDYMETSHFAPQTWSLSVRIGNYELYCHVAKEFYILQKGAVAQHIARAENLKGQLNERSIESLATTIRFVMLNCRTLSSELQQAALSRLLRYLCVPFAALQETRIRNRAVISIENYTIHCGDADENKVGGCAIAVRNDYKNLVKEFGSMSSRCAFLRLRDRRGRKLWIVSAHAPAETAEDNNKHAFYDELNALMSKIPNQQVAIVGIDANAKMGLEQQSDVLGKWYYAAERTSDNGDCLVDLCEQTGLIIASTFKRNHRHHQLTWYCNFKETLHDFIIIKYESGRRGIRNIAAQFDDIFRIAGVHSYHRNVIHKEMLGHLCCAFVQGGCCAAVRSSASCAIDPRYDELTMRACSAVLAFRMRINHPRCGRYRFDGSSKSARIQRQDLESVREKVLPNSIMHTTTGLVYFLSVKLESIALQSVNRETLLRIIGIDIPTKRTDYIQTDQLGIICVAPRTLQEASLENNCVIIAGNFESREREFCLTEEAMRQNP